MIYPRVFLLSAAIVATTLSSSSAFKADSQARVMWQNNCDFHGGNIYSVAGIPYVCGTLCVNDSNCTHWSWSYFKGGTCWIKNGGTDSLFTHTGRECGYVIDRVSSSDSTGQAHKKRAEHNVDQTKQKNGQKANHASQAMPTDKASKKHKSTKYRNGLTSAETAKMLAIINAYRTDNGLATVTIDARLMAASVVHSQDQAKHCTMAHEGTDGSDPMDRIKNQSYHWSVAAENVAAGQMSVSDVMESWWKSAHHRANILRESVTNVGFAVASNDICSEYTRFWTQDFGTEHTD